MTRILKALPIIGKRIAQREQAQADAAALEAFWRYWDALSESEAYVILTGRQAS